MRILNLSTYDSEGGAGRAAYRIHSHLRTQGQQSRMLVLKKGTNDPDVQVPAGKMTVRLCHALARRQCGKPKQNAADFRDYSAPVYGHPTWQLHPWVRWADVIGLYWVSNGFIRP